MKFIFDSAKVAVKCAWLKHSRKKNLLNVAAKLTNKKVHLFVGTLKEEEGLMKNLKEGDIQLFFLKEEYANIGPVLMFVNGTSTSWNMTNNRNAFPPT